MPRVLASCLALAAFLLIPQSLSAEGAEGLLASSYLFSPASNLVIKVELQIETEGTTRMREVEISLSRRGNSTLSLSRVTSPAFLSDMKFLKRSEKGQPDAQWVKTSKGLRRIMEGGRNESVFGSHFTVEDFGSIGPEGFSLVLAPALDTADETAILARPRSAAAYADRVIYLRKDGGLVSRMEYRDAAGRILRRYRVLEVQGEGAEARPISGIMEDLAKGGSTRIRVLSISTPPGLSDRLFSPGAL